MRAEETILYKSVFASTYHLPFVDSEEEWKKGQSECAELALLRIGDGELKERQIIGKMDLKTATGNALLRGMFILVGQKQDEDGKIIEFDVISLRRIQLYKSLGKLGAN